MAAKGDALAILIGKGKPPMKGDMPMEDEPEEESGEVSEDLAMAGEDLASALKSGDGAQVARAFKAMKDLCESEGEY